MYRGCDFTASPCFLDCGSSRIAKTRGPPDNVFPADAAVKSPEIQVYSSRREFPRGHRSYARMRTRAYKYTHTPFACHGFYRKSFPPLSPPRSLSRSLCLSRAGLSRLRRRTRIVSHRRNLNEIRSVQEAVEDSARFDPVREVKPLGSLD